MFGGCTAPTSKPEPETAESICKALADSPAYAGIDVAREYMKMAAWCEVNHKLPTKRRFINWLNRIEQPMKSTTPAKPQPKSIWEVSKVLEAKQKLADELMARHAVQGPLDTTWDDRRNQDQYKALRADIRELGKKMAAMA